MDALDATVQPSLSLRGLSRGQLAWWLFSIGLLAAGLVCLVILIRSGYPMTPVGNQLLLAIVILSFIGVICTVFALHPVGKWRVWVICAGCLYVVTIALSVIILTRPSTSFGSSTDEVIEAIVSSLGAVGCWMGAYRSRGRWKWGWILMGCASASWALGQWYWTDANMIHHVSAAALFPSLADVGFLTFFPLAILAILVLADLPRSWGQATRMVLDGSLIAAAALYASWGLFLEALWKANNTPAHRFAETVRLAYPVSDLILISLVLLVTSRMRTARVPMALVALGLVGNAVADASFNVATTVSLSNATNIWDTGWVVGFGFIGLAGLLIWIHPTVSARTPEDKPTWGSVLLPYIPLAVAILVSIPLALVHRLGDPVLIGTGLFAIAVILLRQLLSLVENRRLNREMQAQNMHLDQLVMARTRDLTQSLEDIFAEALERRELLVRMVSIEDDERRTIAQYIHDDILQTVIAAKMRLYSLEKNVPDEKSREQIVAMDQSLAKVILRMRQMMTKLQPPDIENTDLTTALEEMLDNTLDEGTFTYSLTGAFNHEPNPTTKSTLYRIAHEALYNVIKHAPDAHVEITLGEQGEWHTMSISDNGPGYEATDDMKSPVGHFGLSSMYERAQALGGVLHIQSEVGFGVQIRVIVPWDRTEDQPET